MGQITLNEPYFPIFVLYIPGSSLEQIKDYMTEFFKKLIVVLLLMGFANMVTARPGCHFSSGSLADDAGQLRFNKTESFTVLEYVLESVHGLQDNIPNNEESGAHYSIFRVTGKTALPRIVVAIQREKMLPSPSHTLTHTGAFNRFYPSPELGHFHGFLFRLTPF